MTFWEFANGNPLGAIIMAVLAAYLIRSIVRRTARAVCIYKHGWPTGGVDADGDIPDVDTDEIADKVVEKLANRRLGRYA